MEQSRLLIAIVLCLVIFLAWQFFFAPPPPPQQKPQEPSQKAEAPVGEKQQAVQEKDQAKPYSPESDQKGVSTPSDAAAAAPSTVRIITVQTPLYEAQISEN
ncbi:MAG: membrane protein insertase YidC, partial [Desulfobacterales bacterium]